MSQEIFSIIQEMDVKELKIQLILQCAPLIAGLKISNLLIIKNEQMNLLQAIMEKSDITCYHLVSDEEKSTYILFRKMQMEEYILTSQVQETLKEFGYASFQMENVLLEFKLRYISYLYNGKSFPHEMGILLGYPREDVNGFVQNSGKNYLISGYWKVYDSLLEKQSLFKKFDQAVEILIQLVYYGVSIEDILDIYGQNKVTTSQTQ